MENNNKVVVQTSDGKKKIEFNEEDFNAGKPLVAMKYVNGQLKDQRVIKVTSNKRLVMLDFSN